MAAFAAWHSLSASHDGRPAGLPPPGDALREPKGGVGITNLIADTRPTWVYSGFSLCVAEGEGVTLTDIVLREADGIDLVAGGIRFQPEDGGGTDAEPPRGMAGVRIVTGARLDGDSAGIRFALSCDDDIADVVLRVRLTGPGRGSMAGFAVIYSDDGEERSVYHAVKILLCPRADEAPGCEDNL